MMNSAFEKWFETQHGKRVLNSCSGSDQELRTDISSGSVAEAELRRRQEWDARRESALHAWQAREKHV